MTHREVIRDENGEVLIAVCVRQPLTDEERGALAELARIARAKQEREDPDGLRGDRQRRKLDRLHHRVTPECASPDCGRIANHAGRHLPNPEATP